ncbi:MAG: hypothetical protein MUC48_20675 [Leptolyngbya sp. Prado105]|jgi:hypothetical protein|nr:hypothetical protein [Leptolyngbya sp. Prado105]
MSRSIDWVFGVLWLGINTIAIFAGGAIAFYISYSLGGLAGHLLEGTNEGIVAAIVAWSAMLPLLSAAVGTTQGLLLRDYLLIMQWLKATIVGGMIALALILAMSLYDSTVAITLSPFAAWLGTAIGQWWLLRSVSARANLWLIVAVGVMLLCLKLLSTVSSLPFMILPYIVTTSILMALILPTWRSSRRLT